LERLFVKAWRKGIRFFFANAIAAFFVGFEKSFKYVRDSVFEGFDFVCIFVAWRQNAEM
jgi:hypothetical protein